MAKKDNNGIDYKEALSKSTVHKVKVVEEMKKSFISYAMAVNVSRAIPDVRDGLKPVHRRILYAMGELNLFHDKPKRKCAKVVGDVLGKYHPHGESAVYDALVRLAQDFTIRCPLVEGQGNFGSVDGDPPAAQRYTEARLSKISFEMLRDIDKDTVDFYPTYDESHMQPVVLPSRFPNLLVNGADGIAVGMATNIPPHNLGEVIDGVIAQLENPEITVDELIEYIPAPDYPTGGIVMGIGAVRNAYRTGKGGFICRAKTEIEEYSAHGGSRSRIIVTELPYQVNKARLIESIADLVKEKRIEGISDIGEESDRSGMRIVIEIKRDANAQVVLNMLFKHTQLQVSGGINLLTLVKGQPAVINLKEIIGHYIEHQKEVIVRRTQYDLNKAEERRHILEGLVVALNNIDKVVEIIKSSHDAANASERLMEEFSLSERQVKAILEMQLQRLTHLQVENLNRELDKLVELISELRFILDNPFKVIEIVKHDLLECKENYNTPRRTEISMEDSGIDLADLIENHECIVSLTRGGYIKRLPISEYKAQRRGGVGVTAHKPKEEDFVERMLSASSHDDLLFFTNSGKVFSIKTYELPEAQRTARGRAVINIIPLSDGEKITAVIPFKAGTVGNLFMATRNGFVKKTDLEEFSSIRKGGKIAVSLSDGDSLVSVCFTSGDDNLIIASYKGMCIRFDENDVRQMGRVTRGVMSLKLDDGDFIVDMALIHKDSRILTVTENGYGKISIEDDFRLQSRRGKGIYAGVFNQKTGNLVALKTIEKNQDIMLISDSGICIRVSADEVNELGRRTQGVRIMKLKDENAKVVAIALTESEPSDAGNDLAINNAESIEPANETPADN